MIENLETTVDEQARIWDYFQNQHAESFTDAAPRLNFLVRQIRCHARDGRLARPHVLNVGIGNGYFETTVRQWGWGSYAVDPNTEAVSRLAAQGIRAQAGRLEDLAFGNESFDFVVASEVIEHLSDEQRYRSLAQVRRVLKPGGWFLGTVPYKEVLSANQAVCPNCGKAFHRWGHQRSFDLEDVRRQLRPFFIDVDARRTAFVAFRGRPLRGKIKSLVRLIMARCGAAVAQPGIYWSARKPRDAR